MPYFDKNKDRRKNIVILGTEMLFLFLQKNGIIIVKIKKGSGELSFFVPKKGGSRWSSQII